MCIYVYMYMYVYTYIYIHTFTFILSYFNSNQKDLPEVTEEVPCFAEANLWPKGKHSFARKRFLFQLFEVIFISYSPGLFFPQVRDTND